MTKVSVIIPLYNQKSIESCIESLRRQKTRVPYEIIVVDSSTNGPVIKKQEGVRIIRLKKRTFPGAARNTGIHAAKGGILAFIDAGCIADEHWIDELYQAHRTHVAVGGRIANGNPGSLRGWSLYLCEFGEFAGGKKRLLHNVPSCNISYKKLVFTRYGGFPLTRTSEDTVFNSRIVEKVLFSPDIVVKHRNKTNIAAILSTCSRLGYGSASARKTAVLPGSFLLSYPFLIPLLIPYRLLLIFGRAARSGNMIMFLLSSPLVLLNLIAWDLGFLKGALES